MIHISKDWIPSELTKLHVCKYWSTADALGEIGRMYLCVGPYGRYKVFETRGRIELKAGVLSRFKALRSGRLTSIHFISESFYISRSFSDYQIRENNSYYLHLANGRLRVYNEDVVSVECAELLSDFVLLPARNKGFSLRRNKQTYFVQYKDGRIRAEDIPK